MSTNYDNNCEYCGQFLYAERSTKKYCSNSCKTMACRKRKAENELALIVQKQIELNENAHTKWLAEFKERNRLENNARQSQLEQERIERQRQAETLRLEREEKESALSRQKQEQRMADIKRKIVGINYL